MAQPPLIWFPSAALRINSRLTMSGGAARCHSETRRVEESQAIRPKRTLDLRTKVLDSSLRGVNPECSRRAPFRITVGALLFGIMLELRKGLLSGAVHEPPLRRRWREAAGGLPPPRHPLLDTGTALHYRDPTMAQPNFKNRTLWTRDKDRELYG